VSALLIVDGYNVIRATARYRTLAEDDVETAREALVADVAAYAAGEASATVVFDGGMNPSSTGSPVRVAGVDVIFSPYGRDADTVIEELVGRSRAAGDDVTVVTSDAATQWVVLGQGAARMSSADLSADLEELDDEMSEHTPSGSKRSTVEERLDEETRRELRRLADGAR
jgi:predicted RNA-binding protein with PIN domain